MTSNTPVIWLTGISGAGKTTLALRLAERFRAEGKAYEILDGDAVREFFENDLGHTRKERILNVKRIAFAAALLARHGVTAIVANIAPYFEVRDFIRKKIPDYVQIYVRASVAEAARRDVKGHYARAKSGKMANMIGVDDSYDVPRRADLVVDTEKESVEESMEKILAFLQQKGVL